MNLEMRDVVQVLYSGLYLIFAGIFIALAILSFREDVPAYARDPPCFLPLRKMAVFLYRKILKFREKRRRRGKNLFIPGEDGVRSDLSVLYPSLKARRREIVYRIIKTERILLLMIAGIVLAGAVHFSIYGSGMLQEDGRIERASAGGEDRRISITARPVPETDGASEDRAENAPAAEKKSDAVTAGLGKTESLAAAEATAKAEAAEQGGTGNPAAAEATAKAEAAEQGSTKQAGIPAEDNGALSAGEKANESGGETEKQRKDYGTYTVTIHARQLTEQEARKRAKEILRQFPDCLLGKNTGTEEIRYPLRMPEADSLSPFVPDWESSRYAVLDTDGSIFNSEYTDDQAEQVELTLFLTYADWRFEKKMTFTVRAPVRDEDTILREQIEHTLKEAEKGSSTQRIFVLPDEAGGISLTWEEQIEDASPGILMIGVLVCVCAWYIMDNRLHEKTIERSRQLAIDYPQLISRIVLYLGAGMSVRNIFYKCASEYQEQLAAGSKKGARKKARVRYLYEEILLVCNELDSGIPEAEAYMHFGRRCHSRQYTKLCSLLVQNLRRGNDTLLTILQEEAQSSFEERKNLARELGEEAGTKLLLPMMIMLGVTMLIIIVPAYFSFSM